jgi:(p)ppGpp synthase/HD superfamily hydrolase
MIYFRLLDQLNKDEIVKQESRNIEYQYSFGEEQWIRSSIMMMYRWADNDEYGQFEEVPETEALMLLDSQRNKYNQLLELAIKVATEAHAGQVDKGGKPYINHPQAVAASLTNTEYKIVAYLHDVCEDTSITFDDLKDMGFTYRIVNSIRLLTKTDELTYEEYLRRLRMDSCARAVKMADLKHNMDITRIPNPSEKDYARIEKYKKSLAFLESSTYVDSDFKL